MDNKKNFLKDCINTIAGLEINNESQVIAKEVVLSTLESLEKENTNLKQDKEDFNKWLADKIKIYENKIEKCPFMAGMLILPLGLYKEVLDKFRGVIDE